MPASKQIAARVFIGASYLFAACGSPQQKPASEAPVVATPPPDAPAIDAPPDAGIPENAPAFVFRYNAGERQETWTLRYGGGVAAMVVEAKTGTTKYFGTAWSDEKAGDLTVDVKTQTAKLALTCKHEEILVATRCGSKKGPLDILACYHPDFKTPMPFAPAPGVEYVNDGKCSGYQVFKP